MIEMLVTVCNDLRIRNNKTIISHSYITYYEYIILFPIFFISLHEINKNAL